MMTTIRRVRMTKAKAIDSGTRTLLSALPRAHAPGARARTISLWTRTTRKSNTATNPTEVESAPYQWARISDLVTSVTVDVIGQPPWWEYGVQRRPEGQRRFRRCPERWQGSIEATRVRHRASLPTQSHRSRS